MEEDPYPDVAPDGAEASPAESEPAEDRMAELLHVDPEELATRINLEADTIEAKDKLYLRDIARSTNVPLTELERLLYQFKQSEDKEKHRLSKEGFQELFSRVLCKSFNSKSPVLCDILFEAFDQNNTGYVEYPEFLAGLALLAPTGRSDRIKFAFKCYDHNNTGMVSKYDVFRFARSFFFSGLDMLDFLSAHFSEVYGDPSTVDDRLIEALTNSGLHFQDINSTFTTLGGLFDCMDVDGEGVITLNDVHALERMGILKEDDVKMMFEIEEEREAATAEKESVDPDEVGEEEAEEDKGIDFNLQEFVACFSSMTKKMTDTKLTKAEEKSFATKVNELRGFYKEMERTFEYMDIDGKGSLTYDEFARWTNSNPAVMKWLDQIDTFLDQIAVDSDEEDEGVSRSRSMPMIGSDQSSVHYEVSDISADSAASFDALEGITREEKLADFDVAYLRENIFPTLLPALEDLLKALERRKVEMDSRLPHESPARPINSRRYIAQYLLRNNPKYDTKSLKASVPPPSKRIFDRLLKKTNFLRVELRDLYSVFKRCADQDGVITRAKFAEGLQYLESYGLSPDVCGTPLEGRIFDVFDHNSNGFVDISEFVCTLSMITKGDPKEKARIAFSMVDKERRGRVGREEVTLFLKHTLQTPHYLAQRTVHDVFGEELSEFIGDEASLVGEFTDHKIKGMVELAFTQMRVGADGCVGFDEFYQWRTDQETIKNAMANIEPLFANIH